MNKKSLQLDDLDKRIVNSLVQNSRKSSREIAKELGVSHQTVLARLKALEKDEVIQGYTAMVSLKKIGYPVKMLYLVECGRLNADDLEKVEKYISDEPSFLHAGTMSGDYDLYILAHFRNEEEAMQKTAALRTFLGKNTDLHRFKTCSVWKTIKFKNALEIPQG
jgi:DNA-binding Lrp family transcriptional regulator